MNELAHLTRVGELKCLHWKVLATRITVPSHAPCSKPVNELTHITRVGELKCLHRKVLATRITIPSHAPCSKPMNELTHLTRVGELKCLHRKVLATQDYRTFERGMGHSSCRANIFFSCKLFAAFLQEM